MINVSNDFKTRTKKIKQQSIKLGIVDGELTVKEVHFMTVKQFNALPVWMLRKRQEVIAKELKYSFEGNLFKTIMKQIEITVKNAGELKDKNVNFQYGLYINNNYEYVDLGDYYIKDIEDNKGKSELVVTGYDKMINFMKTFKQSDLQLTYPCTMLALIQKICEVCGVELYSANFFHANLQVDEDYFTAQELTYRDVLEKVAVSTETTIFIKDNKLYLHRLADEPVEKLDASYLTDLTIKEKFGPVNALVLGRGNVEDNVESKDDTSISKNGRCEIRFDENEFVEYKREQVVDEMFEQIKGLEYYAFEGSDLGVMWLEPCDLIEVEDNEESTYKVIYLKANITINTGISSDIEADIPEETNTEYKVTTKEEKKTLKVERLAKKNEGLIKDVIEQQTETGNKLTKVEQDVNGIKETVSSVEKTVQEANKNANEAKETVTITTEKVTKVEKTVDGITESVKKVETNLGENYSTTEEMNSAIEKKAGSINLEVSKKIENIQVGSSNLIPNSAPYDKTNYVISDTNNIELTLQDEKNAPYGKCLRIRALKQLSSRAGIYTYMTKDKLETGKEYCFSLWLKATANTTVTVGYNAGGSTNFSITTSWKKFTHKFTANDTSSAKLGFPIAMPANTSAGRQVFVHSIKLEEGNKVTSWSPAPEDNVPSSKIIASINMSPEGIKIDADKINIKANDVLNLLAGNSINLTSKNITINSNNFNVDKNGNLTCNNATMNNVNISGGSVTLYDNDNTSALRVYSKQNDSKYAYYASNRFAIKDDITGYQVWASMAYNTNGTVIGAHLEISGAGGTTSIDDGNIECVSLIQTSQDRYKKNFEKLNNALDIINNIDIYMYNLKYEKDTDKKHIGFVIGKKYKYREEVTNKENTGAEIYSLTSLNTAGIKELNNRLQKIEKLLEVSK